MKRFDLSLWKKLFVFLKPYKRSIFILIFNSIGLAGIDILFPYLTKVAIDNFIIPKQMEGLGWFSLAYFLLILIQALNMYFFISQAGKIETGITYQIRKKGFNHLQKLSFSYFDKMPVGWIISRLTSDCERLGSFISWGIVDMVWGFILMTGIFFTLLILDLKLALISFSIIPLLIYLSLKFQQKILTSYRKVRKWNSKITASFNEGISGAVTSKTLGIENKNISNFKMKTDGMAHSSIRAAVLASIFLPTIMFLGSIGSGLALWLGGIQVANGILTYGTLVAFLSYLILFFEPLNELARVFAELQGAQASAERIFSLLEEQPKVNDVPISKDMLINFSDEIKGDIKFKNVSFYYEKNEPILTNFNLDVKAGETIALVGETGSGKSTIVNLACRFYEPVKGQILLDGVDYRKIEQKKLHSNLGYVLQTPQIFQGTIFENIAYGIKTADEKDVIEAAKLVNAHEFIIKLPKGYQTDVGESGNLLSSGEKQLISFARAVFADPRIFILDEATSSIDTETERKIQDAIKQVLQNRTAFVIAHRISTIKNADKILVISDGKIIESGTHHKLIEAKGNYFKLYTRQFIEQKEEKILAL